MTEQEIIDGNKLIAEFMGFQIHTIGRRIEVYYPGVKDCWQYSQWATGNETVQDVINHFWKMQSDRGLTCYDSDWNKIMPVAKKIWDYCNGQDENKPIKEAFVKYYTQGLKAFMLIDITSLWSACVQFIKWHKTL